MQVKLEADYEFKCKRCGECCRHYQFVQLYDQDISRLIKLGHSPEEFLKVKNGMAFLKHEGGKCCFLDDGCSVHENGKPAVCKSYPLSLRDARKKKTTICVECPGVEIGRGLFSFEAGLEEAASIDGKKLVSRELSREVRTLGKERMERGERPIKSFPEIAWLVKNGGLYEESAGKEKVRPMAWTNLMLRLAECGFLKTVEKKMPGKGGRNKKMERKELAKIVSELDTHLCDLPILGEIMKMALERLAERDGSRSAIATLRVNQLKLKPLAAKLLRASVYRCL